MYVSDETWAAIAPAAERAGRLPPAKRAMLVSAALATACLVLGGTWLWDRGLILPLLTDPDGDGFAKHYGWRIFPAKVRFAYNLQVTNYGAHEVVILGAGRSGRGLTLTAAQANPTFMNYKGLLVDHPPTTGFPATVAPGSAAELRLFYAVTDCAAVTANPWTVPVKVRQWWGETAIDVQPMPETADDAPSMIIGHYGGRDAYSVEWQKYLADHVCATDRKKPTS